MIDTLKAAFIEQYEAALCALGLCIDQCPDTAWNGLVANHTFCESAFHALFFTDCYLGPNTAAMRQQPFHLNNPDFFRDYEELIDRKPVLLYDRPGVKDYLQHCRDKVAVTVPAETADTLNGPSGFDHLPFNRIQLHLCNIRHIQHHAGQLSLRLRLDTGEGAPWVKTGWRDG